MSNLRLSKELYTFIEHNIISWSIDNTKTAGHLTRIIIKEIAKMEKNEIKKALYKEKPIANVTAISRDGGSLSYTAKLSIGEVEFYVPIADQKGSDGKILSEFQADNIPAQLLIRWLV